MILESDLGPPTSPAPGTTPDQQEATDALQELFISLGLPASLLDWAKAELINGKSETQIAMDLQQRPEFKEVFPEIEAQRQLGITPWSAGQIVDYRNRAKEIARAAGLPPSFYDQNTDFAKMIAGGVSLVEFGDRVKAAQVAAYQIPEDVKAAMSEVLGIGDFTALAFDPATAAPLLERKINEAEAVAAAKRTGFGSLTAAERGDIALAGQSFQQQQKTFGELQQSQELFGALDAGETAISRAEQLGAGFSGDVAAQQRIANRADRRKAQFGGGSGFGASQQGVTGVGTAQ